MDVSIQKYFDSDTNLELKFDRHCVVISVSEAQKIAQSLKKVRYYEGVIKWLNNKHTLNMRELCFDTKLLNYITDKIYNTIILKEKPFTTDDELSEIEYKAFVEVLSDEAVVEQLRKYKKEDTDES